MNRDDLIRRLNKDTIRTEDGHWLYRGYINDSGYGIVSIGPQISAIRYRVHRLSGYIFLGLDLSDESIQINHKLICPFKNCWNPEHLYIGTVKQNGADYRNSRTHCINGHDLSVYGVMRRRYSWEKTKTRLKCILCDRANRNKSRRNKKT